MAKKDIDVLSHEELDKALSQIDKVIMRKYISNIDKRPVFLPSYDVSFEPVTDSKGPVCVVGTNIMLAKLTTVVFDKDENILDRKKETLNKEILCNTCSPPG